MISVLYVPCAQLEEAQKLAQGLLEQQLIACANVWKGVAHYRWEGKVQSNEEAYMLIKTNSDALIRTKQYIQRNHSYDCPAMIELDVNDVNAAFAGWVNQQVGPSTDLR